MRQGVSVLLCVLLVSMSVFAYASQDAGNKNVSARTWEYLEEKPPGELSLTLSVMAGRPPRAEAKKQALYTLDAVMESAQPDGTALAKAIIGVSKAGGNVKKHKGSNPLVRLYTHSQLRSDHLEGALYALLAYRVSGQEIPETALNSHAALIDHIVSSQLREGGFARSAGQSPDILTTAIAVAALGYERQNPYVGAAVDRALGWLSRQQDDSGAFLRKNTPDCIATASVLIAIRICGLGADDPRFVKNSNTLSSALGMFYNADGGYGGQPGQPSEVQATEWAVLAQLTDFTGISPYLPLRAYPGYLEDSATNVSYVIAGGAVLLCTVSVALFVRRRRKKATAYLQKQAMENTTIIHIPMKAELHDFGAVYAQETASGKRHDRRKT